MAEKKKNQNTKKKSLGLGWLIFVVIIMLSNLAENVDTRAFRRLIFRARVLAMRLGVPFEVLIAAPILLIVLLIVVISLIVKKSREAKSERPAASARTSAATQRFDPRTRSFTEPDAYCFTCEATGEDHFKRDRQTRIKQLDEWLKNGLIDREEYRVLKARYEKDL